MLYWKTCSIMSIESILAKFSVGYVCPKDGTLSLGKLATGHGIEFNHPIASRLSPPHSLKGSWKNICV